MYDKMLILDGLYDIEEALQQVVERTAWIKKANDFATTPEGVDLLDIATIKLMAVGEEVKKINKRTDGQLLSQYPNTDWRKIMDLRNFIAHEYFHVDAHDIFDTVQNDVHPLLETIQKMITQLN